jgi:hypothetical protein
MVNGLWFILGIIEVYLQISLWFLTLNVSPTPQYKVQSPLQDDIFVHTEKEKREREKAFLKMMRHLRNKNKNKEDLITLHRGNFHPNLLQN